MAVVVIGAGGHAKVLIDALQLLGVEILGATDPDPELAGTAIQRLLARARWGASFSSNCFSAQSRRFCPSLPNPLPVIVPPLSPTSLK